MKRLILAAALVCAASGASADEYGFKDYDDAQHFLTTVCAHEWLLSKPSKADVEATCANARRASGEFYWQKQEAEAKTKAAESEARSAAAWEQWKTDHPGGAVSLCPKPHRMTDDGCK